MVRGPHKVSERDWISRYFAPLATAPGAAGLRDDVAELTGGDGRSVITVDALIEGVHFLPTDPIDSVARKLVRVNVSDIYSAGALPRDALLALGWPANRPERDLAKFSETLRDELKRHEMHLLGGDTVGHGGALFLSLTVTGRCLSGAPVRRSGAQPGQELWVTGQIGAACLGFEALKAGDTANPHVEAYRNPPIPNAHAARLVADHAAAAMDISDGLLGDLSTLAGASGLGAHIALDRVPFAGEPSSLTEMLRLATWGDDYQLLFAAAPDRRDAIRAFADRKGLPVANIGELTSQAGLVATYGNAPVNLPETLGFEHG